MLGIIKYFIRACFATCYTCLLKESIKRVFLRSKSLSKREINNTFIALKKRT